MPGKSSLALILCLIAFLLFGLPSPRGCAQATTIPCIESALRSAIESGGTIDLSQDCTYVLTANLPPITRDLAIHGNGATIDGRGMYRLLYLPAKGNIAIENLTVQYGVSERWGGGVFARQGNITILDSTIRGNAADSGGGICAAGSGAVTVLNSTVAGNAALDSSGYGGYGGGIKAESVTITNSAITGNSALSGGGVSANLAIITDSTFNSNWSHLYSGGAIHAGEAHITRSTFANNVAEDWFDGGGAVRAMKIYVSDSVFYDNHANVNGGALSAADVDVLNSIFVRNSTTSNNFSMDIVPGGGAIYGSNITIDHSLFQGNSADNVSEYASGSGGAIFAVSTLRLTNSALVGNTVQGTGGAVYHFYGGEIRVSNSTIAQNSSGIEVRTAAAEIANSTIVDNQGVGLHNGGRWSGGDQSPGTVDLSQSIVAGNGTDILLGDDVVLDSLGYNLLGTTAERVQTVSSDVVGVEPGLDAFNGVVYPLTAASPALDAIPLSACSSPMDQRDTLRPQGEACDIGAVEMRRMPDGALVAIPTPDLPEIPVFDSTQQVDVGCTEVELRQAVTRGGTLNLAAECMYFLRDSLPPITADTVINGNGAVIDARGRHIFFVDARANLTLSDITLANAYFRDETASDRQRSRRGGAVYVASGDVTIRNSALTGGSDIYVARGDVLIDRVTFPDADDSRFGVYVETGNVTITNSTFRLEYPNLYVNAVYVGQGDVSISNTTCLFNFSALGRGPAEGIALASYRRTNWDGPCFHVDEGVLSLEQTIVASNRADIDLIMVTDGEFESRGYNLLPTDTGGLPLSATDIVNPEHGLDLFDGAVFPLMPESPALDAVPPEACAVAVDQRGVARPQGEGGDIGAVEME